MLFRKSVLALSISAVVAATASAADAENFTQVTVTAQALDTQVRSITTEQLENQQASDMKDILKSLPSVIVDGNVRYGQKIYVRGLEDKFANVTIDGANMGGQLFHHAGDQMVDASLLKISEVELGPNSALSGPGVVNGSFKYETKDPGDYLEKGENFGGKASIGYETGRERIKSNVALFSRLNDQMEFVGIGSIADDGNLHLGDGSEIANKESKLESGLVKLVFRANEDNLTKLGYNVYEDSGNRNISGEKAGSDVNNEPFSAISRDTLTLKHEYNPDSDLIDLEFSAYTNEQYMTRDALSQTGRDGVTVTRYADREYSNDSDGFDIRNTSILGNHRLTYGVDYNQEKQSVAAAGLNTVTTVDADTGETTTSTSDSNRKGGEVENYGLYVQDEMTLGKLILTLGARYDDYQLGGIYEGSFDQLSPKAKVRYQTTENLSLKAAYGRIFKGPQLGETLTLGSSVVQDADTTPQTGHNFEVGFDYDLTKMLKADDAVIGFNTYRYNVDDYSHPTKNSSLVAQGEMEIYGFETIVSYTKDALRLNASHTYTGGDQTNTSGQTYDPITANIHVIKLGVDYALNNETQLNYYSQIVPGNSYTRIAGGSHSEVDRPGYAVHDINLTYKPARIKDLTLNFGIDNLFDKAYERHTAFTTVYQQATKTYEIGRNFKLQASYRF